MKKSLALTAGVLALIGCSKEDSSTKPVESNVDIQQQFTEADLEALLDVHAVPEAPSQTEVATTAARVAGKVRTWLLTNGLSIKDPSSMTDNTGREAFRLLAHLLALVEKLGEDEQIDGTTLARIQNLLTYPAEIELAGRTPKNVDAELVTLQKALVKLNEEVFGIDLDYNYEIPVEESTEEQQQATPPNAKSELPKNNHSMNENELYSDELFSIAMAFVKLRGVAMNADQKETYDRLNAEMVSLFTKHPHLPVDADSTHPVIKNAQRIKWAVFQLQASVLPPRTASKNIVL